MPTSSGAAQASVARSPLDAHAYVVQLVEGAKFVEVVTRLGFFWALINELPSGVPGHRGHSENLVP